MRILISTPSLKSPHGGIRIILEWANRLSQYHKIFIYCPRVEFCDWFNLDKGVKVVYNDEVMKDCDCLVITSPHTIHLQYKKYAPKKIFLFMQMLEHMFKEEKNNTWFELCKQFYQSQYPLISISEWNIERLKSEFNRKGEIHYVGNGVNLDHFPISKKEKSGNIVLVEGWEGYNPAKDTDKIGPKVAKRLKDEGYTIVSYGLSQLKTMPEVLDKYYFKPDIKTLNKLYDDATILLKASKYDARSCSPMEAMTKGTVTARGIIEGDDDLINAVNCLKVCYDEEQLYTAAKVLLTMPEVRNELAENCYQHIQRFSWSYWISEINKILEN